MHFISSPCAFDRFPAETGEMVGAASDGDGDHDDDEDDDNSDDAADDDDDDDDDDAS